jgi:hypothetical protein
MKFKSMAEISNFVADQLNEMMRNNREAMAADGWSEDEIDATFAQCMTAEQAHAEMMAQIKRFIGDPDVQSLRLH